VTTLSFDVVSHAELAHLSAAFASGTHVVLGAERDGAGALPVLAAGIVQPRVGRVTLDGKEPFAHAGVRRRVAALCAEERLPPGRTVSSSLGVALRARGDARSVANLLDAAGLSHFATRRTAQLSGREARALALVFALTHPEPDLLALFEPLALLDMVSEDFVLPALARAASAGAVVLCTANRLEDAARLGGSLSSLERGVWFDPRASELPLSPVTLRVLTPEPERLAARLSESPEIVRVVSASGSELLLRGADLERAAAHLVASARSGAIRIEALRYDAPSLDALAAARAELARRWDEHERERIAQGALRAANAQPPSSRPRELP
jgi:ABC-2 type transport system ATP-binding protein